MLKPTLLGVEAPKVLTWCRCGGVHVMATFGWEIDGEVFTVELSAMCVECGQREYSLDE